MLEKINHILIFKQNHPPLHIIQSNADEGALFRHTISIFLQGNFGRKTRKKRNGKIREIKYVVHVLRVEKIQNGCEHFNQFLAGSEKNEKKNVCFVCKHKNLRALIMPLQFV